MNEIALLLEGLNLNINVVYLFRKIFQLSFKVCLSFTSATLGNKVTSLFENFLISFNSWDDIFK